MANLAVRQPAALDGLGPEVGELGKQLFLFEEFLMRELARGLVLPLKEAGGAKVLVHGHCHQKAFGITKAMRKVLSAIPGLSYEQIESSCCGMAGSFGLEAEHYATSQAMAGLSLLPAVCA
jgi:glycerol-3-phosphate dehydrogenase subunit C